MRLKIIAVAAFICCAAPVSAELLPATIAFLLEIGIDPNSPEVTEVADDQVGPENLNTLAADRSRKDVRRFIATRNYLRTIKRDNTAEFPPNYEGEYLTFEEQQFVGAIIAKRYGIGPKQP